MSSAIWIRLLCAGLCALLAQARPTTLPSPVAPPFAWSGTGPLVGPANRPADPCISIKDPSIVFCQGKWHLFCTIRSKVRTHQIEYLCFDDWSKIADARRCVLTFCDGYFCAPQVFYFAPQRKWYLVYQSSDPRRATEPYGPYFSTNDNIADPNGWSRPLRLVEHKPAAAKAWLDFWVICDDRDAYLFFTSLDGRMWRTRTKLADFPTGWQTAELALQADVFEASHTYRIAGQDRYLTIIEAQGGGGRFYKAYTATRLDGTWSPLADSPNPFAAPSNVQFDGPRWTDSISHGELIRSGYDQTMRIDPDHLQLIFQGATRAEYARPYAQIPWRLGLLSMRPMANSPAPARR